MPFVGDDPITAQAQLDAVLQAVSATVWVLDRDLRFEVSRGVVPRRHGLAHDELVGLHLDDYLGEEAPERDQIEGALDGARNVFSTVHPDGRELENFVGPLRLDGEEAVAGVVGVTIDVTERNRLAQARDERLRRAQQLETLGRFAGGVAHDINNMLFGINGFIDLALSREIDADAERHLRSASATLERSAEMTRQLLAFSRGQAVELQPLSLTGAVRDAAPLLEQLAGDQCLIELALAAEQSLIMADPTQLEQVLTNLVVNAREAGSSTIVVGTRLRELDLPLVVDGFELCPGSWVELAVSDDGDGMDAETRIHLCEPFFTTKAEGTGLGLATVSSLVRRAGGGLAAESSPGAGTTIRLFFPAV